MPGELISREALERIIHRAAELQAGEREIGDGLTKDEVLALGKDVGIPGHYLQQALLEEQTRTVTVAQRGGWAWLTGPGMLSAARVVPGERAAVERALAHWMEQEELLQVKRRYADRTTWEPKSGAFASIQRALAGGRRYVLGRIPEVGGQVTPLEPGFCLVQLSADVQRARRSRIGGAAALVSAGALGTAGMIVAVIEPAGLVLLPAALSALGAIPIVRTHRRENETVMVALEQVLDRLERGEIRAEHALPGKGPRESPFLRIAEEIRKTFQA
jgi:hypothetical protein